MPETSPAAATVPQAQPPAANGRPRRGPVARFFRSLFSHLLFAGIAVAGVLGYLYHGVILHDVSNTVCAPDVLGQWMGHGRPGTVMPAGPVPTPQSHSPVASRAVQTVPVPAITTAPAPPAETAATKPADTATASSPAASGATSAASSATGTPASGPSTSPSPSAAPTMPAAPPAASEPAEPKSAEKSKAATEPTTAHDKPATADNAPASTATAVATLETKAEAEGSDVKSQTTAQASTASDPSEALPLNEAWLAARKAYAAGKPDAIDAYRKLVAAYPDIPDLTGELGNIYFQKGDKAAAAAEYYETALRLIRRDQTDRAACLIGVLKTLDAARAEALKEATKGATCPSVTR